MVRVKKIDLQIRAPLFLTLISSLAILSLLLQACSSQSSADLAVGDQASDFSLPTSDGKTVSLSDYVGARPTLLYFHMAVG
jgi:hypothetical protein